MDACFPYATYIPGEEYQDWPDGNLLDVPFESMFCLAVRILQSFIANLEEVFRACNGGGDFLAGVCNRSPHLLCKLLGELIFLVSEQLQCFFHDGLTVRQGSVTVGFGGFRSDGGQLLELGVRYAITFQNRLVCGRRDGDELFE
jgi:hypothetical protein